MNENEVIKLQRKNDFSFWEKNGYGNLKVDDEFSNYFQCSLKLQKGNYSAKNMKKKSHNS